MWIPHTWVASQQWYWFVHLCQYQLFWDYNATTCITNPSNVCSLLCLVELPEAAYCLTIAMMFFNCLSSMSLVSSNSLWPAFMSFFCFSVPFQVLLGQQFFQLVLIVRKFWIAQKY
jgi:hypothetical protein